MKWTITKVWTQGDWKQSSVRRAGVIAEGDHSLPVIATIVTPLVASVGSLLVEIEGERPRLYRKLWAGKRPPYREACEGCGEFNRHGDTKPRCQQCEGLRPEHADRIAELNRSRRKPDEELKYPRRAKPRPSRRKTPLA